MRHRKKAPPSATASCTQNSVSKEFLIERIEAGDTLDQLCAAAGVTRGQLRVLLAENDLKIRPGARSKLPHIHEMVAQISQGHHPDTIAERYGVTPSAVYVKLKNHGTSVRAVQDGEFIWDFSNSPRGPFGLPAAIFRHAPGEINNERTPLDKTQRALMEAKWILEADGSYVLSWLDYSEYPDQGTPGESDSWQCFLRRTSAGSPSIEYWHSCRGGEGEATLRSKGIEAAQEEAKLLLRVMLERWDLGTQEFIRSYREQEEG